MAQTSLQTATESTFSLGRYRKFISIAVFFLLSTIVCVPLFSLCWKAGVLVEQTETGRVRTWALTKLVRIVAQSPGEFSREIAWSLTLGQLASISAVVVAFLVAWNLQRRSVWLMTVAMLLVGLAVPGPILALFVAWFLNLPFVPAYFYDQSIVGVWFVLAARTFPIAFFLVYSAVRSLDRSVIESARVDGASVTQQVLKIGMPMMSVQLVGAWLISLIWSMGELSGSVLITPPGVDMISKSVFDLVHYGVEDRLAGICLFCIVSFVGVASLGVRLVRKG